MLKKILANRPLHSWYSRQIEMKKRKIRRKKKKQHLSHQSRNRHQQFRTSMNVHCCSRSPQKAAPQHRECLLSTREVWCFFSKHAEMGSPFLPHSSQTPQEHAHMQHPPNSVELLPCNSQQWEPNIVSALTFYHWEEKKIY